MENHHFLWQNSLLLWPCSSSQTVSHYQRAMGKYHRRGCSSAMFHCLARPGVFFGSSIPSWKSWNFHGQISMRSWTDDRFLTYLLTIYGTVAWCFHLEESLLSSNCRVVIIRPCSVSYPSYLRFHSRRPKRRLLVSEQSKLNTHRSCTMECLFMFVHVCSCLKVPIWTI